MEADPLPARAYGDLKQQLAARFPEDAASYTDAKTSFIEEAVSGVVSSGFPADP